MWPAALRLVALLAASHAPSAANALRLVSQDAEAASDQAFWAAQWGALEHDVVQLQQLFTSGGVSNDLLQLSAKPSQDKHQNKDKKKLSAAAASTAATTAKKAAQPQPAAAAPAAPKAQPIAVAKHAGKGAAPEGAAMRLAKAESLAKGLMGKAALAPMLDMLEGLYGDQKKRIGDLNKKEEESKKYFAKQQAEFNGRIKEITDKHNRHRLSDEFFKNETRDYTRQFKYWEGVRERNHKQFHTALKITHGMMQREKDMIAKYKAAISLKVAPAAQAQAAPAKVEAPEVVLVEQEMRTQVAQFCREALLEIHRERTPSSRQNAHDAEEPESS